MNKIAKKVILIGGGDGLVGRHIISLIDKNEYDIVVLSRSKKKSEVSGVQYAVWDTDSKTMDDIPAPDHIINLAGAGIADERWTPARKNLLISSRVNSAATIKKYLQSHNLTPRSYISASAVGYYGNRSNEVLTEQSSAGHEFMSDCCMQWEDAAQETGSYCQRHIILRIGIVLSAAGGALPKMLMTKSFGLFNYFGTGNQYYPWIHIDDLCRIFIQAIENETYNGVYNAVAPQEITNKNMMREIMEICPFKGLLLPAPAFMLKLILGEMARVVLNSDRVIPQRLSAVGFSFTYTKAGEAVRELIHAST